MTRDRESTFDWVGAMEESKAFRAAKRKERIDTILAVVTILLIALGCLIEDGLIF